MLSSQESQMRAYVFDSIRTSLCSMTLDHAFESKEEISQQLKFHLQHIMSEYGFMIMSALVTDLAPDSRVREAMNEINTSKRLKESAYQRAEGEKILKVKKAEAEMEAMYLSGKGVARQRKAIMDGLKDSIVEFSNNVQGSSPKDVMDLLVLNQYFDTLQELGSAQTKVVFLDNGDNHQFRNNILEAQAGRL
jgi:regulator of protease activity HflC (stomatin/prohibitin superfamily)